MGRDPIGACCNNGPSQSCPPTRASPRSHLRRYPVTNHMTPQPDTQKVIVGVIPTSMFTSRCGDVPLTVEI